MIKIQQLINGEVKYEDLIKSYNYSIPSLLENGATKIVIEYPTSTIIVTPVTVGVEVIEGGGSR